MARFDTWVNSELPIERELRLLFSRRAAIAIFDIGACEGEDSVRYARLFPNSAVYAVEPIPSNLARLQETVNLYTARNVRILPIALSDTEGRATMFVSSGRPPDAASTDDWDYGNKSSSLLAPDRHLDVVPWVRFDDRIEVETRTLEEVCAAIGIEQVDFIHMDVQGAELAVLRGAGSLLERLSALWLEVEAVPLYRDQPLKPEVERFLGAHGFVLKRDTVDSVSGDQLWVRRSRYRARLAFWLSDQAAQINATSRRWIRGAFRRVGRLLPASSER